MDVSTLPILPPVKDRIPGQYYNYKGEYRLWNAPRLINRDIINNNRRKRRKENPEKYRKKTKKYMENPINKLRVNISNRMNDKIVDNNINCEELLGCSWGF